MNPPESWYGHEADVKEVIVYTCKKCDRDLHRHNDGSFTHEPRFGFANSDSDEYARSMRKAEKEAALSAAIPYKGAIKKCQAHVSTNMGRWTQFGRCKNSAKWVVLRRPYHEAYTSDKREALAVCTVHAKDTNTARWHGDKDPYRFSRPADEQVEPEYLLTSTLESNQGGTT